MDSESMRILWVKTGLLHPLDTGGKLRTYNMLKELKKKHNITFLSLVPDQDSPIYTNETLEYCSEVIPVFWEETKKFSISFYVEILRNVFFSSLPYAIEKYKSLAMSDFVSKLKPHDYDLVVYDFLTPTVNLVKPIAIPTLLFQHNVESEIWKRHYLNQSNLLKRLLFWEQWKKMKAFEQEKCKRFDGVVTVSQHDSMTLQDIFGLGNILGDVPTGVDTDYFCPAFGDRKNPNNIVFSGSMDWLPNEDAILYFVKEIYPLIKHEIPDVTLTVAGRSPSKRVTVLHDMDQSISVTGTVPDIRPYVASAAAMIVPLRIGGGTRIKIYEGMALGVPIVSSSIGAEGLPVRHGTHILLADSPKDFANGTIKLLRDGNEAKSISDAALKLVRKHFSWRSVCDIFESYCLRLIKE